MDSRRLTLQSAWDFAHLTKISCSVVVLVNHSRHTHCLHRAYNTLRRGQCQFLDPAEKWSDSRRDESRKYSLLYRLNKRQSSKTSNTRIVLRENKYGWIPSTSGSPISCREWSFSPSSGWGARRYPGAVEKGRDGRWLCGARTVGDIF